MSQRSKPVETLTEREAATLLAAAGSKATKSRHASPSTIGIRNQAILAACYFAGLRIGEVLALKIEDLDLANQQIHVLRGKGGKRRVAKIIGAGVVYLDRWIQTRRELGISGRKALFCTLDGKPLSDAYCRQMISRAADRTNIQKRIHLHQLRHSHAVLLAERHVPMNKIQKQLGHASLATTSVYLDSISSADLQEIADLEWMVA